MLSVPASLMVLLATIGSMWRPSFRTFCMLACGFFAQRAAGRRAAC